MPLLIICSFFQKLLNLNISKLVYKTTFEEDNEDEAKREIMITVNYILKASHEGTFA